MMGAYEAQDANGKGWPRRRSNRGMSEINITAFVDILLVLLIIFMMTSQYLRAGFDVRLPQADTPGLEQKSEPIIVTLSLDKRLSVGDVLIESIEQLRPLLENELSAGSARPVYLKADRAVPYGTIIGVMSRIRKAGIQDIGLMTEAGPEEWFEQ